MQYFDKNGKEIKAGMKILMEDGSIEMVYDTEDQYGNPNLGINASNEEFLKLHPNWAREYYSLSMFRQSGIEVCPSEQEIRTELEELAPIIEGTELALDYGEKVSKEDYEKYEAAIARRTILTSMLGEDSPTPEMTINDNYQDNRLNTDSAQGIIAEYGWNRVQWVLANTIQQHADDGRFSPENKKWAESFYMPEDDNLWHYSVEAHPGLVNMFVDRVRKEWQALGLFDRTHCTDEGDFEDKLIVLKPSSLKDQYKTPEFQLFYATSGFGCDPKKIGTQVAGHFLKDDEYAHFRRADFIGVIREDCIPEWAQEKLKQYQEPVEQTDIKME